MEDITKAMNDLKVSVDKLKEENESLKSEMQTLKELRKDNEILKQEVRVMRFDIFTTLQKILKNQGSPQQQQQQKQQQQQDQDQQDQDHQGLTGQTVVCTSPFRYKWGAPSMMTNKEREDLNFSFYTRVFTPWKVEFDADVKFIRFIFFIRPGEYEYDRKCPNDEITDASTGSFTSPIPGRYRFDVKGKMRPYDETGAVAKWYLSYIHKDDDIFDNHNPKNDDGHDNEEIRREREKAFCENYKRQLLFTFDEETTENEMSIGVDCDKDVRFWIEVDFDKGDLTDFVDNERSRLCMFKGRLVG